MKSISVDVVHYNRKKEQINIQAKENRKKIEGTVFEIFNNLFARDKDV